MPENNSTVPSGLWLFTTLIPPLKGWAILKAPIREMSVGSFIGYNSTRPENVQPPGTAPE